MPVTPPARPDELEALAGLLRKRLEVIADVAWRNADPAAHLEALANVSEAIFALHGSLRGRITPRLEHFLANCSYEKALAMVESELIS